MKHFTQRYFFFLLLLFLLFYLPTSSWSVALNEFQRLETLEVLEWILGSEQVRGDDIWINPHYKIIITQACNGVIPILVLYASILAYPASWSLRLIWIVVGYGIFFLVNVIRLLFVTSMTQNFGGQSAFFWSHDLLGNGLLMGTGVGLFILFIRLSHKQTIER